MQAEPWELARCRGATLSAPSTVPAPPPRATALGPLQASEGRKTLDLHPLHLPQRSGVSPALGLALGDRLAMPQGHPEEGEEEDSSVASWPRGNPPAAGLAHLLLS